MYGNVLNNSQIASLVTDKKIHLSGFEAEKLRLAHYPLTAGGIIVTGKIGPDGKRRKSPTHDLDNQGDFEFQPNQYAIVEINEYLVLPDGIVGHFVPASKLIEQGFGLTLGKLDPGYGNLDNKRQQVRFGIKNLMDEVNSLQANQQIAHIYFVDLRGLNNARVKWDNSELERMKSRSPEFARRHQKASDDGNDYGDGNK